MGWLRKVGKKIGRGIRKVGREIKRGFQNVFQKLEKHFNQQHTKARQMNIYYSKYYHYKTPPPLCAIL